MLKTFLVNDATIIIYIIWHRLMLMLLQPLKQIEKKVEEDQVGQLLLEIVLLLSCTCIKVA